MTYVDQQGEHQSIPLKLPYTQADWQAKRVATDAVLDNVYGVATRVGDETVGEMWLLFDGEDVLNEVDPQFFANIRNHINRVLYNDPFHVSANTDPKGERSKPSQEQDDPDTLLNVVKETNAGIIVCGAKFETAAAYANQAFTKPTIVNWAGGEKYSDHAVGFICDLGRPGIKMICRTGCAGRTLIEDCPLANEPMIPLDAEPSRSYFLSLFTGTGIEPKIALRSKSFETVRGMVGNWLGYALLTTNSANNMSCNGSALVSIPIKEPVEPSWIVYCTPLDKPETKESLVLKDLCEGFLRRVPKLS